MRASEYCRWLEENDPVEVAGKQYCLSLYTLAESCQAKAILEVGHGWGWSATAFAASLGERGGRLISLDICDRRKQPCIDFMRGRAWEFHQVRSHDFTTRDTFDLIYFDASPAAEDIFCDFEHFYPNLRPGGLLVVDGALGQTGPTTFMKRSRLPWTPLQYSERYAHAVHRKRPWPTLDIGRHAACYSCSWGHVSNAPAALESYAMQHARATHHRVYSWREHADSTKPLYVWEMK